MPEDYQHNNGHYYIVSASIHTESGLLNHAQITLTYDVMMSNVKHVVKSVLTRAMCFIGKKQSDGCLIVERLMSNLYIKVKIIKLHQNGDMFLMMDYCESFIKSNTPHPIGPISSQSLAEMYLDDCSLLDLYSLPVKETYDFMGNIHDYKLALSELAKAEDIEAAMRTISRQPRPKQTTGTPQ